MSQQIATFRGESTFDGTPTRIHPRNHLEAANRRRNPLVTTNKRLIAAALKRQIPVVDLAQ